MVRYGGERGRGQHGRVLAAAIGVTALAAATSVWTASADPVVGRTARTGAAAAPAAQGAGPGAAQGTGARQRVSASIAHASDRGARGVDITIDDGPDPVWTPQVLRVLRENGVKATFCMVGTQAKAHPDLVEAVVAAGHRLCDHTVSHDTGMDRKPPSYQAREIIDAARMITEASGGVRPVYYRAPGGAFTPYSRSLAASHGMRPLGWNVDSEDFRRPGSAAIVATVEREIANGPTVLFHDAGGDRAQTVAALREVLPWLRRQGYVFGFPVR
ncbi:polysaccharide deacetylase family protein [Streptomyces sp. NPDC046985]|uniref:polysaccharide deacetylase family protein n=1 Tax=Streptomyces sp. NPDC046985 TaxID=3155377 RepID=UPI0033C62114